MVQAQPMMNPYEAAQELAALFGRFEHALKRANFLRNSPDAQADWNKFARMLGAEFYDHIQRLGVAETLLRDPPRKLMREPFDWAPRNPAPLKNVVELFEQGVCRVRNNLVHGEKFVSDSGQWERDVILVVEALAVLREAQQRVPVVSELLGKP